MERLGLTAESIGRFCDDELVDNLTQCFQPQPKKQLLIVIRKAVVNFWHMIKSSLRMLRKSLAELFLQERVPILVRKVTLIISSGANVS